MKSCPIILLLCVVPLVPAAAQEQVDLAVDAVGMPGFQFIQDPLDYSTRTHHSDLDVYDHIQPPDLMQASAILASVVYDAATRPEMLPLRPLPKPLPKRKDLAP